MGTRHSLSRLSGSHKSCITQEYLNSWHVLGRIYHQRAVSYSCGLGGTSIVSVRHFYFYLTDPSLVYLQRASCSRSFFPRSTLWNKYQMASQLWKIGDHGAKSLPELEPKINQTEKPTYSFKY